MSMSQPVIFFSLSIATLSVVLGFAALLSQRIYIDPKTNKPTEIKIPIIGRMKTNYPSLIFVLLGFALIFYIVQQVQQVELDQVTKKWIIKGRFITDKDADITWKEGNLTVHPCGIVKNFVSGQSPGVFQIDVDIKKGGSFEDEIEYFEYSGPNWASETIYPKDQLEKHENDSGYLKTIGDTSRHYEPIPLEKTKTPK